MRLIVWNSQGAKWDAFWTYFTSPLIATREDIVGLLVEAGWAPWVQPGEVHINEVYPREEELTWYDATNAANSPFCQGIAQKRQRTAFWIPWVKTLDAMKTNTRCSLGGLLMPMTRVAESNRILLEGHLRPVLRIVLSIPAGNKPTPELTILLVHLVSGNPNKAQEQMNQLIDGTSKLISEGTSCIIVGDLNINLQSVNYGPPVLPSNWRYLRTNQATQQSGGELDFALLYDPNRQYGAAGANVVQSFKSGNNQSDHAVMQYTIPLR